MVSLVTMVPCNHDIKESVVTILYHGSYGKDRNAGNLGNKAAVTSVTKVVANVHKVSEFDEL